MPAEVFHADGREGPEALQAAADRALELVDRSEAELSVMLCDDDAIAELNAQWRGKDQPTDVLSFPQGEGPPGAPPALGDVVISLDTAGRQADEAGHPLATELVVLLVHGLLHLLGHDHHEEAERAAMRAEESRVLTALGHDAASLIARA